MKKIVMAAVLRCLLTLPVLAGAQEKYPTKPIEVVVPFAAGGSTDVLARLVAKFAPKYFDKPLVVVNKPGGGGITGTEAVVRSKPDGYSLFLGYGSGHDLVTPHFQKMPYDTFNDLIPVARLSVHSIVMIIRGDAPYKNMKEFIEWGKKKDQVTASVSTKAGSVDITFQAVGKATGMKIVTIPFRGGAESVTAIVGGQTDCGGNHPSEIISHIKAKRLIPIAVALENRDPADSRCAHLQGAGLQCRGGGLGEGGGRAQGNAAGSGPLPGRAVQESLRRPGIHQGHERHRPAGHVPGPAGIRPVFEGRV